jgi:glycosyltransferase involved in cell wall biosynthesis
VATLRRHLREGRYDLLHARFSHDHHLCLLAMAGLPRSGLRVVRSCELLANARAGLARGLPFALTDAFAVPSQEHAVQLCANHGVAPERVLPLPGRVDAERFHPGPSRLRAELGIPEEAPVVGIVSRIKPDRAHAALLRAFARVSAELPAARLGVVGRGEGEAELRSQVGIMGLDSRVRFAGYRTGAELEDAYRAFDVKAWLAPGNDGTCRAVREAMASGCAVLGGSFGAVAEAVVDGDTGRLCDPSDEEATARALAWLLTDRRRAKALGEAGRQRVLERYTPRRRFEALVRLYGATRELPPARVSHHM